MSQLSSSQRPPSVSPPMPSANHLSLVVGGVPAHTQRLTGEGTGYSHNHVAPKIGPVLRPTDFGRGWRSRQAR